MALACRIMEARGSHHLPPAGGPRKSSSVIQREPEGLRTRGPDGVLPGPRAGEDEGRCPSSSREAEKKGPILLLLCFCSVQDVNRLDKTHLHCGRHSAEFTDCNAKPIQEHAHRHTQKKRLVGAPCGLSGWPLPSPVITLEQPALLGMRGAESPGRSSHRAGCTGRHLGQVEEEKFTEAEL